MHDGLQKGTKKPATPLFMRIRGLLKMVLKRTRTPDNADRQMSRNKKWRKSGKDLARAKI